MDRGDDLLEKTRNSPKISAPSRDTSELFENARILKNEGLKGEAIKVLHRILMLEPHHPGAQELLKELRDAELQSLLQGTATNPIPLSGAALKSQQNDRLEAESNLERLVGAESKTSEPLGVQYPEPPTARDRMDLGIAFFEMELHEDAIHEWKKAAAQPDALSDPELRSVLIVLQAQAYLATELPFEAQQILLPLEKQTELSGSVLREVRYWLARALEKSGDLREAHQRFQEIAREDALYRDCVERLTR